MTREKMTQMLCETLGVARNEAEAALEARAWNLMDAAVLLQRERSRARKAEAARARRVDERKAAGIVREALARFSRRRAEARRVVPAAELPADVLAPLMLMPAVYACRCW